MAPKDNHHFEVHHYLWQNGGLVNVGGDAAGSTTQNSD